MFAHISRQHRRIIFTLICLCAYIPVLSYSGQIPTTAIKRWQQHNPSHINVGISVFNAQNNQVIYQYQSQQMMTPASIHKLWVAETALEFLKPSFKFNTTLGITKKIHHRRINGDVIIHFVGDPSFTHQNLNRLIHTLKQKGVNHIRGNIILDTHVFSAPNYPPGWMWDDLTYAFAPPINAIMIDENRFMIHISAQNTKGKQPSISTNITVPLCALQRNLTPIKKYQSNCPLTIYPTAYGYSLSGCLVTAPQGIDQIRQLAIRHPNHYATNLIRQQLKADHIRLDGHIISQNIRLNIPRDTILATHHSQTLKTLTHHLLEQSDNLYAESFLRTIGNHFHSSIPGHAASSFTSASESIITLQKNTADLSKIRYVDGSGLSRYNATNTNTITQLLTHAWVNQSNTVRQAWLHSLLQPNAKNRIHYLKFILPKGTHLLVKTGSMTGVISLAGYMGVDGHQPIAFTWISHGFCKKRPTIEWLQQWVTNILLPIAQHTPRSSKTISWPIYQYTPKKTVIWQPWKNKMSNI